MGVLLGLAVIVFVWMGVVGQHPRSLPRYPVVMVPMPPPPVWYPDGSFRPEGDDERLTP